MLQHLFVVDVDELWTSKLERLLVSYIRMRSGQEPAVDDSTWKVLR